MTNPTKAILDPVTDDGLLACAWCNGPAVNVGGDYITCGSAWNPACPGHMIRTDAECWNTRVAASDRDVLVGRIETQNEAIAFAHKTLVELKIARTLSVDIRAGGAADAVSKVVNILRAALTPLGGEAK